MITYDTERSRFISLDLNLLLMQLTYFAATFIF